MRAAIASASSLSPCRLPHLSHQQRIYLIKSAREGDMLRQQRQALR
jgi:hypothetical protein